MNWKPSLDSWGQGLHHAADLLIKRGTAMGALIPTLFLCPVFLVAAWVFQSNLWLSVPFSVAAVGIIIFYMWHYTRFANTAPDRLQSEQFRYEMQRMHLIAGKELPNPIPADRINLGAPSFNPNQEVPSAETIEQHLAQDKTEEEGK